MTTETQKKQKVLTLSILGETKVGKTSICKVFMGIEFNSDTLATIGIEKLYKEMTMSDGNVIKIKLWDTAGQERFRSITLGTIKSSKGVIVVFDVSDEKSFKNLNYWIEQIQNENDKMPIVLFGNKCDLEKREVSFEQAKEYADTKQISYFETSAKTKQGLDEGFKKLAEIAYKTSGLSKGFNLAEKQKQEKQENSCCGGGSKGKEKKKGKEKGKEKEKEKEKK